MKNLKAKFALLLLSMLGLFTGAHAQLTPSGDSYTNTATPTTNFGAARSPLIKRLMKDLAGYNLNAADGFLAKLSQFEDENLAK